MPTALLDTLSGRKLCPKLRKKLHPHLSLAHQNRTIAIASDFRVDGAKSPEIPQKEGVLGSEIAAQNRKSLATFHRTLKSQCNIAFSSRKSLRFLGSAMGIAIANRKNRCDFGALRCRGIFEIQKVSDLNTPPVVAYMGLSEKEAMLEYMRVLHACICWMSGGHCSRATKPSALELQR